MNKLILIGMVASACLTSGVAVAGDYGHDDMKAWHDDHRMMMGRSMMGRHEMTGTVESVDPKTGWVKVKTDDGSMTVHFPADSIKDLKEGDKIIVHLGYSKVEKKPEPKSEKPEKK